MRPEEKVKPIKKTLWKKALWVEVLFGVCALLLLAADQWVKHWARTYLMPIGSRPFIPGLLNLTYAENRGAAFGLFQGARWLFIPMTVLVLGILIFYYVRLPRTRESLWVRIPLVFIFAGAVGNFIDRLWLGYVADMLEFAFFTFPIFNVADCCLVGGTAVMAFVLLFIWKS